MPISASNADSRIAALSSSLRRSACSAQLAVDVGADLRRHPGKRLDHPGLRIEDLLMEHLQHPHDRPLPGSGMPQPVCSPAFEAAAERGKFGSLLRCRDIHWGSPLSQARPGSRHPARTGSGGSDARTPHPRPRARARWQRRGASGRPRPPAAGMRRATPSPPRPTRRSVELPARGPRRGQDAEHGMVDRRPQGRGRARSQE